MLACGVLWAGTAARAADPIDEMSAEDLLARAPELEESGSWYLRGDVGYVFNETPDVAQLGFVAAPSPTMGDAGVFGVGVGVRLSELVRADLTADYRSPASYDGHGLSADVSATTLLANAYLDLGTWHAFTPYVGAGVGASYVSVSDIRLSGLGLDDADGWGFTWALMAGTAVTLATNWQLDLGYRYVSIENVSAGTFLSDAGQAAHELRLGVRYLFD